MCTILHFDGGIIGGKCTGREQASTIQVKLGKASICISRNMLIYRQTFCSRREVGDLLGSEYRHCLSTKPHILSGRFCPNTSGWFCAFITVKKYNVLLSTYNSVRLLRFHNGDEQSLDTLSLESACNTRNYLVEEETRLFWWGI